MGKYILHVFTSDARRYYDLEGLWTLIIDPMKESNLTNDLIAARVLRNFKSKMDQKVDQDDDADKDFHERNLNECLDETFEK